MKENKFKVKEKIYRINKEVDKEKNMNLRKIVT
jgi:hypothetical protein